MRQIAILGSTGSIGRQTLDIVAAQKEHLQVAALAAGRSTLALLAQQIRRFLPQVVSVPDEIAAAELREMLGPGTSPEILCGPEGLSAVATATAAEIVVSGLVGALGIEPTAAAVKAGKTVALANKETLVAAGSVIMPMVRQYNARIIPVDSEHSAIFQSLIGHANKDIARILLTASGGPFRTWSAEAIAAATAADALKHPNWSMGKKITIDSATLMNKGLEIIEARWLFDLEPGRIKVVIHPQSILHSAVEFVDGSIVGQMGLPDMRLPIHYALFWPQRMPSDSIPRLDLAACSNLTFEEPNYGKFPCLKLASQVAAEDNTRPAVLNAANEIAVEAFLSGAIKFDGIAELVASVLDRHKPVSNPSLADILESDRWSRNASYELAGAVVP